ncbi:MAG: Kdo hydroxylase family protein [Candidatus Acidiferrales bacterium]
MSSQPVLQHDDRMPRLVEVPAGGMDGQARGGISPGSSRWSCEELEKGNILYWPAVPFDFPEEEQEFLLHWHATSSRFHKNIAYRPSEDKITGLPQSKTEEAQRLHKILRGYSRRVYDFLSGLVPAYREGWRRDFASFRPYEEQGRDIRLRARNDLLHTDAFPTRPIHGDRILRFFTNINPSEPRVWVTGETFEALAERYARSAGLPKNDDDGTAGWFSRAWKRAAAALKIPGADRSPYDDFMHRFHNFLKENEQFQKECPKQRWEFPPGSCWMVFTDMVSHSVLSGRFALEQTFIISRDTLALPQHAPVAVLERLCGHRLAAGLPGAR